MFNGALDWVRSLQVPRFIVVEPLDHICMDCSIGVVLLLEVRLAGDTQGGCWVGSMVCAEPTYTYIIWCESWQRRHRQNQFCYYFAQGDGVDRGFYGLVVSACRRGREDLGLVSP